MIILYFFLFSLISIYSYSQVDLNLNLSTNSLYLLFENAMKNLGFYNRNLSFWIFLSLSLAFIILYGIIILRGKLKTVSIPRIFYFLFFIFYLLSYPAFLSYDIFNYLFDARIVVKYHENPYLFSAGRYVFDEWLRFMRWTHRVYPYGPMWLILTIIPLYLGFGRLVTTIFFFKIFNLLIFLGCIKLIKKISGVKNNWLLFALHPIVIYDFLISMHNEGLMLFFLLASMYFLIKKRNWFSLIFLALSIGVKFVTAAFLPIYLFLWWRKIDVKKKLPAILRAGWMLMIISLIPVFLQREIYSWYFILPIGLMTILPNRLEKTVLFVLSFLIFRYMPFILIGEYNQTVLSWQTGISLSVLGMIVLIVATKIVLSFLPHRKLIT